MCVRQSDPQTVIVSELDSLDRQSDSQTVSVSELNRQLDSQTTRKNVSQIW